MQILSKGSKRRLDGLNFIDEKFIKFKNLFVLILDGIILN